MEHKQPLGLLPFLDYFQQKDLALSAGLFERKRQIDYSFWANGHDKTKEPNPEWEAFQEAFPLLWQHALRTDRALYGRRERLSKRIASMMAKSTKNAIITKKGTIEVLEWLDGIDSQAPGFTWFCTLTFGPEILASTTAETRAIYVKRFLKATFGAYVANLDYGGKNGREHYHAVAFLPYSAIEGSNIEALLVQGYQPAIKALAQWLGKPWADKCGYASLRLVDGKDKLWNNSTVSGQTVKTIYDPSPVGFAVPLNNVWRGFTKDVYNGNNAPNNGKDGWIAGQYFNSWFTSTQDFSKTQGWMFYRNRMVDGNLDPSGGETYYPACGFRSTLYNTKYTPAKGKVSSVGAIGYYWSNAAANNPGNHTSYCFHFYHYGVIPTTTHSRSNGCAVRPVREQ